MNDWKETTLGEIAKFKNGKSSPERTNDAIYPVFGSNGIIGYSNHYNSESNSIIIGRVGSYCGAIYYSDTPCWVTDNAIIGSSKQTSNPKFIYYFLANYGLNRLKTGSGQPLINQSILNQIEVKIPPLKEQEKIAAILSSLDAKIDNLRRQNETLEQIAQTLFKHWFIDFEFPPSPPAPLPLGEGCLIRRGEGYKSNGGVMVASELGDIPEGWRVGKLGDVCKNHSKTHKFEGKDKIIFINTGDVLEGKFLHKKYSDITTLPGQAKKKIEKDDILYSEIRPINKRFAYVNFNDKTDDYVVSTKFMIVRANENILPRLLYLILKRQDTIQEFNYIAESRSGTFPQITFESVSYFSFPLPNIELQKKLMSVIIPMMEKQEFNENQIQTLTKTRDEILPKLMKGEIRVRDEVK